MSTAVLSHCAHELFEQQAATTPRRTALRYKGAALTYSELNSRANQFAHYLRERGVGPEALVGLCMPRSLEAIVAILGILKAGAGYVPVEPTYPLHRIAEIFKDAQVSLIFADSESVGKLQSLDITAISPESDALKIGSQSKENLSCGVAPDNVAYITYTSGSTGKPLGVILTHRSITNGLNANPFDCGRDDEVCSLNSPLSFGFSASRLFLPLFSGVPVVILPDEDARYPERLVAALESEKVTNVALITPVLHEILSVGRRWTDRLQRIRTLGVGGSTLSPRTIELFQELFPRTKLLDGYAASEIGGPAIVWEFAGGSASKTPGQVFPNVAVYILDENRQAVPAGVTGELYVGAPHLARGYVGQPGLTAERFLKDPFSSRPDARMFRTGDVGRQLSNGDFQVLGRVDDQTKIRGHRVNLREIEMNLETNGRVQEAAIAVKETANGPKLIAYVVGRKPFNLNSSDLRGYLRDRLPDFMMPAAFAFIESLPRNDNGKLDRRGLAALLDSVVPESESAHALPSNPIEAALIEIWQEVLDVDHVGVHDKFIDLGGDSLLAVHVNSRVLEQFGIELPAQALLEHPTISELCETFF